MDLLKRHWEKILLSVSLLALLAAAVILLLKISVLKEEVGDLPNRFRRGSEKAALDINPYERAIDRLTNPVLWADMPMNPFAPSTVVETNTPNLTNIIVHPTSPATTIGLISVNQVPFTMMFLAYVGDGRAFQLNMQFRPKTFFVEKVRDPVKDMFWNTGFNVTKFEKKETQVHNASLGGMRTVDVSELTLEHPGEKPIVLVLRKPAVYGEPVATVECTRHGYGASRTQVRRGQRFRCGLTIYNVVDIKPDEMLIIDEQKPEEKPVAIKLMSATPVSEEEGATGGPIEPGNQNQ